MKRDRYKTVTDFALLVPASKVEAMGEATFLSEYLSTFVPSSFPSHIRAVTLDEIKKTGRSLKGIEDVTFGALLSLKGARESGDALALGKAYERMDRVYRMREEEHRLDPIKRRMKRNVEALPGMTPEETIEYLDGLRPGPKAAKNPGVQLSYELSKRLSTLPEYFSIRANRTPPHKRPQIVLWWFKQNLRSAIYCPDLVTALYIHTFFLAPTGELGFRICPYDGEQFFQERPNQEYCCPAHRDAHRVARFRSKRNVT